MTAEDLPELLEIWQQATHNLQAAGLKIRPISTVMADGHPVTAVVIDGVAFANGEFTLGPR